MENITRKKQLAATGYSAFLCSGICAISAGVIVSILQEKYGFSFSVSGTLLSVMSIGNMLASFAAGILPGKIGPRNTVALLCSGYFIGYLLMAFFGNVGILIVAFLVVGIAKGGTINNCTVLVGNNSKDRTKGMSLMHACYAGGAMLCPFLITWLTGINTSLPMIGIAVCGLVLWLIFYSAKLPKVSEDKGEKKKTDFSFMKDKYFWYLTGLIFCQNAAETAVTGWLVTYYKNNGILSGNLSTYTVTIMWGATLIARLLVAFVIPIKNTFKSITIMGIGCTILYLCLVNVNTPVMAIIALFGFAFAMAPVNPVGMAGIGKAMNETSVGVLLPIAGLGQIVMPWIIGIFADSIGLSSAMALNVIPCAGIIIMSILCLKNSK